MKKENSVQRRMKEMSGYLKYDQVQEMNVCKKGDQLLCVEQKEKCDCGYQNRENVWPSECDRVFHCGYLSISKKLLIEKNLF